MHRFVLLWIPVHCKAEAILRKFREIVIEGEVPRERLQDFAAEALAISRTNEQTRPSESASS